MTRKTENLDGYLIDPVAETIPPVRGLFRDNPTIHAIIDARPFDVQVPRMVPIITNLRVLNRSSAGFDVEITGYSSSREISSATFDFGAASGANLITVQLQPQVSGTRGGHTVSLQQLARDGARLFGRVLVVGTSMPLRGLRWRATSWTSISCTVRGMVWGWKCTRHQGSPAASPFDLKPEM